MYILSSRDYCNLHADIYEPDIPSYTELRTRPVTGILNALTVTIYKYIYIKVHVHVNTWGFSIVHVGARG